jgi:membrane protease subunit HflC
MRIFIAIVLIVVVALLAYSSCFAVDRTEFVYLTEFGQHKATFDGETDAGLHWKLPWPIQSVQRIDHRLQAFDLPETELLTPRAQGKGIDKTLTIGAYVCWRVADKEGVDRFIRTVGRPEDAQRILGQRISSRLGAAIGRKKVEDLIGVADAAVVEQRMDRLRDQLLDDPGSPGAPTAEESLRSLAKRSYGIDIVDIRLRRFNHPASVRDEIFKRIRSERAEKAMEYTTDGMQKVAEITSLANRTAKDIDTQAKAQAERLRKEADIKADEIRNQAQSQDPEFYTFLQKLKTYQGILGEARDTLLLSSKHELFDMLLKPPRRGNGSETNPMPKSEGQ